MRMAFGLSLQVSIAGRFKKRAAATPLPRHADEKERRLTGLMIRALEGDAEAYRSALQAFAPLIREFFSERTGATSSDLEKLVQETLIAAHLRRPTYSPERSLLRWIYAIAGHKLSLYRKDHAGSCSFFNIWGKSAQARIDNRGALLGIGAPKGQCHIADAQDERGRRSRSEPPRSIAKL